MSPLTRGVGRGWGGWGVGGVRPPTEAATSNFIQTSRPGAAQDGKVRGRKAPYSTHLCFWGAVSRAQQKRAPLKGSFVSENPPSHAVK